MNTFRLLFWSVVAYVLLLALVRGIVPSESTPTISLTGIPLVVIIIMIGRDLARRSTSPTVTSNVTGPTDFRGNPLEFLSGQFRVAANASNSYFENVVRARLKELLTAKLALETGLENETVRRLLSDTRNGRRLVDNDPLYRMVYGPIPPGGLERMRMIGEAIDLIRGWKG
ncbi:MAG TPA: hypothetical protein VNA15_09610 [Candidatus Angelobacter sp.]|nr:hypothetical protein [Candidatus Angelobacter sp.]